ncbi:MAG TPA: DUF1080 domain-containing protein, partial [Longimicrobium sp.]|nr:DUF1080 domain-containing protein [Longimicrobium sp.]
MRELLLLIVPTLFAAACSPNGQADGDPPSARADSMNAPGTDQDAQGWRPLFDGRTTAGWHAFGGGAPGAGWQVVDGALSRVGQAGDIVTDDEFGSFELELEWRVQPGGNSGIFFHVVEDSTLQYVWQTGPEMQVLD